MRAFWDCDWPDNVRELKNIIDRLIVLSADGDITSGGLPEKIEEAALREGGRRDESRPAERRHGEF